MDLKKSLHILIPFKGFKKMFKIFFLNVVVILSQVIKTSIISVDTVFRKKLKMTSSILVTYKQPYKGCLNFIVLE